MGTSYDGICFYGVVFNADDEGWGEDAERVLREGAPEPDFDAWFDRVLGIGKYDDYPTWIEYNDARKAASIARFGVLLAHRWVGFIEFSAEVVYVAESREEGWRHAPVPVDQIRDVELCERYRLALEKLRELLPGGSEPGWFVGCCVG